MQRHGHLEGPDRVHVSGDDGNSSVTAFGVSESKAAHQIHLFKQEHEGNKTEKVRKGEIVKNEHSDNLSNARDILVPHYET